MLLLEELLSVCPLLLLSFVHAFLSELVVDLALLGIGQSLQENN
jgi:hypothetical protein